MATFQSRVIAPVRALKHRPWPLSRAVAPKLLVNETIEEEHTPYYDPTRFYPAHLGDVLNERYQLATKLGYGSGSTIWLARDLNQWRWLREKYVALKINASAHHSRENAAQADLDILRHISRANPRHKGWGFVRGPLDSFTLQRGLVKHLGLVFESLREPLWIYRRRFVGDVIPSNVLKILLQMILHGVDYLHSECHVIHTDLKPDNIMIKVEDPSILEESARGEHENPLPRKDCLDGRTTYLSRSDFGIPEKSTGIIQTTDFDLSTRGDKPNKGCIQADVYRAPEVSFDAGYSYSTNIWSLGVTLWDVLEGKKLFKEVDPLQVQNYDELDHLGHIFALLGPPPKELLEKGTRTDLFYESDGQFKGTTVAPSSFNFENSICKIHNKDKRMSIEFVQRMLKWRPKNEALPRNCSKIHGSMQISTKIEIAEEPRWSCWHCSLCLFDR